MKSKGGKHQPLEEIYLSLSPDIFSLAFFGFFLEEDEE
jgi:hypothetical protein